MSDEIKVTMFVETIADAKEVDNLWRRTGAVMSAIKEMRIACENVPDEAEESEAATYACLAPSLERLVYSLVQIYRSPDEMDRDITALKGFVNKTHRRPQG